MLIENDKIRSGSDKIDLRENREKDKRERKVTKRSDKWTGEESRLGVESRLREQTNGQNDMG